MPNLGSIPFRIRIEQVLSTVVGWASLIRFPSRHRANRTLIVRSTSLGDFAVFLPFMASVQQLVSDEQVDLLIISRTGDIAGQVLGKSSVICAVIDPRSGPSLFATIRLARERLRHQRYDRVFFATQNSDAPSGQLRKLAMIRAVVGPVPRIIGMGRNLSVRTRGELLRADVIAENQGTTPFVACQLIPLATRKRVQALVARPDTPGAAWAMATAGLPQDDLSHSFIAFYVHAKDERKRWPLDRFIAAGIAMLNHHPGSVLLFVGGPEDADASDRVAAHVGATAGSDRVRSLAGRLNLPQLFELLGRCRLFVGNDGAPVHYAALAGCRVVSIFCNWESAGLWEPIAATASISVRPASVQRTPGDFGITAIPVAVVVGAARTLWESGDVGHRIVVVQDGRAVAIHQLTASPFRVARATETESSVASVLEHPAK